MSEEPQTRLYLFTPPLADAAAFAPQLEAALDAADVACVLLVPASADEGATKRTARQLAAVVQKHECALLLPSAQLATRSDADGAHIRIGGPEPFQPLYDTIESLKPQRIVGAGGLKNRHDSMQAGESDVDYLMFGEPTPDGYVPPLEQTLERVSWWSELFNVPCVAYAANLADVAALAAAGADFVALGDAIWSDPRGPAVAARDAQVAVAGARVAP